MLIILGANLNIIKKLTSCQIVKEKVKKNLINKIFRVKLKNYKRFLIKNVKKLSNGKKLINNYIKVEVFIYYFLKFSLF